MNVDVLDMFFCVYVFPNCPPSLPLLELHTSSFIENDLRAKYFPRIIDFLADILFVGS